MADPVEIKRGCSVLYLLETANRSIEQLKAAGGEAVDIETFEQFELAETVVNVGPTLIY